MITPRTHAEWREHIYSDHGPTFEVVRDGWMWRVRMLVNGHLVDTAYAWTRTRAEGRGWKFVTRTRLFLFELIRSAFEDDDRVS